MKTPEIMGGLPRHVISSESHQFVFLRSTSILAIQNYAKERGVLAHIESLVTKEMKGFIYLKKEF